MGFLKQQRKWIIVAGLIYLLSYLPYGLSGEYNTVNHGGMDWRREWCPRLLISTKPGPAGRTKSHLTLLGIFYGPCIAVDRLLWHRTESLTIIWITMKTPSLIRMITGLKSYLTFMTSTTYYLIIMSLRLSLNFSPFTTQINCPGIHSFPPTSNTFSLPALKIPSYICDIFWPVSL